MRAHLGKCSCEPSELNDGTAGLCPAGKRCVMPTDATKCKANCPPGSQALYKVREQKVFPRFYIFFLRITLVHSRSHNLYNVPETHRAVGLTLIMKRLLELPVNTTTEKSN